MPQNNLGTQPLRHASQAAVGDNKPFVKPMYSGEAVKHTPITVKRPEEALAEMERNNVISERKGKVKPQKAKKEKPIKIKPEKVKKEKIKKNKKAELLASETQGNNNKNVNNIKDSYKTSREEYVRREVSSSASYQPNNISRSNIGMSNGMLVRNRTSQTEKREEITRFSPASKQPIANRTAVNQNNAKIDSLTSKNEYMHRTNQTGTSNVSNSNFMYKTQEVKHGTITEKGSEKSQRHIGTDVISERKNKIKPEKVKKVKKEKPEKVKYEKVKKEKKLKNKVSRLSNMEPPVATAVVNRVPNNYLNVKQSFGPQRKIDDMQNAKNVSNLIGNKQTRPNETVKREQIGSANNSANNNINKTMPLPPQNAGKKVFFNTPILQDIKAKEKKDK